MSDLKTGPSVAVIGDLKDSRAYPDRLALHRRFEAALAGINRAFTPPVPLRITVGDEFQGIFPGLGAAVQATLRLRLALLPDIDVRQGIGWGDVLVLEQSPRVEDGPAWWAARAAIEAVEAHERTAAVRVVRTAFAVAPVDSRQRGKAPDPDVVNAALMLRDQVVGGLSERSMSVLDGLMRGRRQQDIADDLGISASAVSQRIRADGIGILLASDELLARL